jgi:hypothetical protein
MRDMRLQHYNVFAIHTASGAKAHAVTKQDADRYLAARLAKRPLIDGVKRAAPLRSTGPGFVFAVVADPEMRPSRIKVGWATDIVERLEPYRMIAPGLRVVGLWRAEGPFLEQTALLLAKRHGTQIGPEVFDGGEKVIPALESMFLLLDVENVASTIIDIEKAAKRHALQLNAP